MSQQIIKESVRSYTAFIEDMTEMVKSLMGEEYNVRIYKVTKNNSLELDSLVILKKGVNFAPNIYMLPYFEAYMQGADMKELSKELCNAYQDCKVPVMGGEFTYSFESLKAFIIYRLVNYEKNKRLLEKIPHIKYLDMAITFHCLVRDDGDGIGTIRITNEHLKMWNATKEELYMLAVNNTRNIFPSTVKSMDEVILGMLKEEYAYDNSGKIPDKILDDILYSKDCINEHKMYILSNQKGINGATCLLYQNVLRDFAEQIHSDLFILPSSIHEVILIPYDNTISKASLAKMVCDVNYTQVASDEVLSDNVYIYSRKNDSITL
jgi:hypothetical protein